MVKVLEAFGEPLSFGGQESFVKNAAAGMNGSGVQIDFLTPYYCDDPACAETAAKTGGCIYALGAPFRPGGIRSAESLLIYRFLKDHHYDVIHIHSGSNTMLAVYSLAARRAGINRIIVHSHCTGIRGWKHGVSKAITSPVLKRIPSYYFACSREAGEWKFPHAVCGDKLHIIRNCIDCDNFVYDEDTRRRIRREYGVDEDDVLIGNAGRLTYQKNQKFLIDILADIRQICKESGEKSKHRRYKLLLAGDGEDRNDLEKRADMLGLSGDVLFTGAVTCMNDIYQAMDIFAMPSVYEGFPMSLIEAQASGLEIIASDSITADSDLTGHITFMPLSDRQGWIEFIMSDHIRHPDGITKVKHAGYDASRTTEYLYRIYTSENLIR